MKIFKSFKLVASLIAFSFLISCEYENIEVQEPPTGKDTISFATQITPIFESSQCLNCHDGGQSPNLSQSNAYMSIMNSNLAVPFKPDESIIYYYPHPVSGSHDTKYTTIEGANLIEKWILQGALDN